ncbi:hypothetical protein, partial [Aeromicrobium sp.]|uniref:hypothetical protein n=1 Tax=Aeromicrobium sp. TaxID=1871063 RepID=UPI0019CDA9F1
MATSYTLTGTASDLIGAGSTKRLRGYVEPSQPVINDPATNTQFYGNKALTFATNGAWSITLVGTGALVAAYRVVIEYVDDAPRSVVRTATSNFFSLTANTAFGSKVDVTLVSVTTGTLESVYAARDAAAASAAAAAAVGNTNDTIIASGVNDTTSATRAALSAAIVQTVKPPSIRNP